MKTVREIVAEGNWLKAIDRHARQEKKDGNPAFKNTKVGKAGLGAAALVAAAAVGAGAHGLAKGDWEAAAALAAGAGVAHSLRGHFKDIHRMKKKLDETDK